MSGFDGRNYQERFDALARSGVDVHGEATFLRSLGPASVLDAGCGTGRVAIELARHGIDVCGVDVDASMIAEAKRLAPHLEWLQADLVGLSIDRRFDVVVLAGNVPLFAVEGTQAALVASCAAHVAAGGALVAGFQLGRHYGIVEFDEACREAGLVFSERYGGWGREPYHDGDDYAVSVHSRPAERT